MMYLDKLKTYLKKERDGILLEIQDGASLLLMIATHSGVNSQHIDQVVNNDTIDPRNLCARLKVFDRAIDVLPNDKEPCRDVDILIGFAQIALGKVKARPWTGEVSVTEVQQEVWEEIHAEIMSIISIAVDDLQKET